ncbi:triose-phosphate isomerase [Lujinxingia vulgaris]|uniref:Triosephosphate isomerase n=1 Tax=Lujinxingia vulgaris TaxID=2600176 RepID=A0A5C6XJB8_9DELT|nr:triose-phosphate isomerase [Lujinxingia vulgaris]TXD37352.1 triose-phosphate isomerase [Lujinxingia vulgaris]
MRTTIVAGNWKMNLTQADALTLGRAIAEGAPTRGVTAIVAPVALHISALSEALASSPVLLASQNAHWAESGAYTGELAAPMLRELGVRYAILGHSERRQYFGEDDEGVNRKTRALLAQGLHPIVCFGESLEEREGGRTRDKVEFQVRAALSGLSADEARRVILAYEPIWAIGTGKTASPQQAQEVHAFLREVLEDRFDRESAQAIPILYGGSVKPSNFAELLSQPDIDGGLVGGASLKAESYLELCQIAVQQAAAG